MVSAAKAAVGGTVTLAVLATTLAVVYTDMGGYRPTLVNAYAYEFSFNTDYIFGCGGNQPTTHVKALATFDYGFQVEVFTDGAENSVYGRCIVDNNNRYGCTAWLGHKTPSDGSWMQWNAQYDDPNVYGPIKNICANSTTVSSNDVIALADGYLDYSIRSISELPISSEWLRTITTMIDSKNPSSCSATAGQSDVVDWYNLAVQAKYYLVQQNAQNFEAYRNVWNQIVAVKAEMGSSWEWTTYNVMKVLTNDAVFWPLVELTGAKQADKGCFDHYFYTNTRFAGEVRTRVCNVGLESMPTTSVYTQGVLWFTASEESVASVWQAVDFIQNRQGEFTLKGYSNSKDGRYANVYMFFEKEMFNAKLDSNMFVVRGPLGVKQLARVTLESFDANAKPYPWVAQPWSCIANIDKSGFNSPDNQQAPLMKTSEFESSLEGAKARLQKAGAVKLQATPTNPYATVWAGQKDGGMPLSDSNFAGSGNNCFNGGKDDLPSKAVSVGTNPASSSANPSCLILNQFDLVCAQHDAICNAEYYGFSLLSCDANLALIAGMTRLINNPPAGTSTYMTNSAKAAREGIMYMPCFKPQNTCGAKLNVCGVNFSPPAAMPVLISQPQWNAQMAAGTPFVAGGNCGRNLFTPAAWGSLFAGYTSRSASGLSTSAAQFPLKPTNTNLGY